MKTNLKEGACSLYHPEILEKPAARPKPGHWPATAATGPGASPDTHFFQGWKYYHGWRSIGVVLHHCQCSHSPSSPGSYSYTPKVCYHPPEKTFHHHETVSHPRNYSLPVLAGVRRVPGGVTFWVTPSFPWLGLGGIGGIGGWWPLWCACRLASWRLVCVVWTGGGALPFMFPLGVCLEDPCGW